MLSARRASALASREHVHPEQRQKWEQAFAAFDLKQTGFIDAEELTSVMKSLNMAPHAGEVEAMIAAVDHDGDNLVTYDDFELMMIAGGRGQICGFSHVVVRHIQMGDVASLVINECTNFVDRFCRQHVEEYLDLPHPDEKGPEHKHKWHDIYKKFTEHAELTLQNVMVLWGVASQKNFDEDFVEAVQSSSLLDDFLKLTDYEPFLSCMRRYVLQHQTGQLVDPSMLSNNIRPTTPCTQQKTQNRLAEVDEELAELDMRRHELIAERRRLIGCQVQPITTTCLKQELERRQWLEDVGLD